MTGVLFKLANLPTTANLVEARPYLVASARYFLEAGGVLSLADWAALSPVERAAFTSAGRQLHVERVVDQATAARDELGALKVKAKLDDGRAHDDAVLRRAVNAARAALKVTA